MRTINIKGKEYVPVVERIKELHKLFPNATINTEIIDCGENRVVVKATIDLRKQDEDGFVNFVFTGHSQAEWGKGIMGNVALEVAETSAVGRALGFANIGLIDGIATADEMRKVGGKKTREEIESTDPLEDNEI